MADGAGVVTPPATPCPHCGVDSQVAYHWPPFPNVLNGPARILLPQDTTPFLHGRWRCAECIAAILPRLEARWTALLGLHQHGVITWPANAGPHAGWWRREEGGGQHGRTP